MSVKTQAGDGEKIDMIKDMIERHMNADCLLPGGSTCRNCGGRCAIRAICVIRWLWSLLRLPRFRAKSLGIA